MPTLLGFLFLMMNKQTMELSDQKAGETTKIDAI